VREVEQMPAKSVHESSKLFEGETVLGNQLPCPRLPKSLRQLYGNSMDADSRIMPFFHPVHDWNLANPILRELRGLIEDLEL